VVGVHQTLRAALERARAGRGATLLELVTYRVAPHSTSDDPSRYRTPGELESWEQKDPLHRLARHLRLRALLDDAAERQIDDEVSADLTRAIGHAEGQGRPALATLFEDVYAAHPWHLTEQKQQLERSTQPSDEHHRTVNSEES
jgi:TPP-dependent pyruvate/acetoin dehydrogenase alpha subunit